MIDKYEYTVLANLLTYDNLYLEQLLSNWGKNGWELSHFDERRIILKRLARPSVEDIGDSDAV